MKHDDETKEAIDDAGHVRLLTEQDSQKALAGRASTVVFCACRACRGHVATDRWGSLANGWWYCTVHRRSTHNTLCPDCLAEEKTT